MASVLNQPHFHDEAAAFEYVESLVWPKGPVCPKCGNSHEEKKIYDLKGVRSKPSKKSPDGVLRHGLKKCGACRKQFTVRVGTIFESSHIPLHLWMQAFHLMCSSKKGISSHQLHRVLGIKYQSAWFMSHRIREAMRAGDLVPPMGGEGKIVEVDETYIGRRDDLPKNLKPRPGDADKQAALSLVERGGKVRSFVIDRANAQNVEPVVTANIARETQVMTDQATYYKDLHRAFESHDSVNHSKDEWARYEEGRPVIHTNTIEGYFSIFKRGMKGVYQHCSEKHLHRYLAEFDFRHNNRIRLGVDDVERTDRALTGVVGKRLTYRCNGN